MSTEKMVIDELDAILINVRRAEQNIIGRDSSDKLDAVKKLIEVEEHIKTIKSGIKLPLIEISKDTLIDDLQGEYLSIRAGNVLRRSGCRTIGDVTRKTYNDVITMRNMGRKSAEEIFAFLQKYGFTLSGGEE